MLDRAKWYASGIVVGAFLGFVAGVIASEGIALAFLDRAHWRA